MAQDRPSLLSPVSRIVAGSLYRPNDKDFDGKPLVIKTGPNAGQPTVRYFFALAIPKGPEPHWAHTAWGAKIWEVGCRAFPQASQRPDFSWKIEDGDSQIPNKRNKKPCEQEGWRGCWIVKLSSSYQPTIYNIEGGGYVQHTEPDFVKPGYWVEAAFTVDGNGQTGNPGVYLNPNLVCFRGYGPEIVFGPNVNEVGFGQAPLPAGVSSIPLASTAPPPAPAPAPGGYAPAPAPGGYAPGAPGPYAAPPAPAPMPVMPQPQFLQMPPAPMPGAYPNPTPPGGSGANMLPPGANLAPAPVSAYPSNLPPAPAPAPAAPAFQMTAKAGGASREAFLQAGWTDAALIQQGYMTA